jgi:hypothetical protein
MDDHQDLNPWQVTPGQEQTGQETPEAEVDEEELVLEPKRSKKWWIIGALLVIFLGAAAFLGARLLRPPDQTSSGGDMRFSISGGGGQVAAQRSVRLNLKPAPEIPTEAPTISGLFVRREDQSIFIGTGRVQLAIRVGPGGSGSGEGPSSSYDGPVMEVVVNHETKIYQDITDIMPPDQAEGDTLTLQQEVKPGSLDDLGSNSMVTVWGEKRGDRYIARVITFR